MTRLYCEMRLEGKLPVDDQPTLYICQGFRCEAPVVGVEQIKLAVGTDSNFQ